MATVFETIENTGTVSPDQARELSRIHAAGGIVGERVSNVYLRGLVGVLDSGTRFQEAVQSLYPAILEGATTPDVAPLDGLSLPPGMSPKDVRAENRRRALERNRRTNWARTVHSALRAYERTGSPWGDIPSDVTKSGLVTLTKSRTVTAAVDPIEEGTKDVNDACGVLAVRLSRLRGIDAAAAADALDSVLSDLTRIRAAYAAAV